MDQEKIKRYLIDFQDREFNSLRVRGVKLTDSSKINTVIGARRTGKTYLLFTKIQGLEEKIDRKQILYLNFENPVLNDISFKDMKDIIELHWSIFPETIKKKLYLFIDEPQSIDKWELAVRELYDDYNCNIFITGSSSNLLSKEIATSLRGRSITTMLLPLSFREFLSFNDLDLDLNKITTKSKALLINYFDEFMKFGGYPEVVLVEDSNEKLKIIKDYLDLTIYKDIVDRYNIKNTRVIKWLIDYIVSSIAKEVSLNKIFLNLKSRDIKLSKNTLYEYFSMLEDSFFIFTLRKFEYSLKRRDFSIPKVYLDDIGFLNLFSLEDYGKRMENIVFLELARRKDDNPSMDIHYWKSLDGKEVDFLVTSGKKVKSAIQVCYSFSDKRTEEREKNALLNCLQHFKLKEGLIITKDHEQIMKFKGKTIKAIPIWKWLLES
jgi:uncharacterized protein